jgi:hypothetical protein
MSTGGLVAWSGSSFCACLLLHITYLLCLGSCGWLEFQRLLLVSEGLVSPVRLTRLARSGVIRPPSARYECPLSACLHYRTSLISTDHTSGTDLASRLQQCSSAALDPDSEYRAVLWAC